VSEVRAEGLRFSYGGPDVLDGVDLRVPSGSLTSLIGPSGCGKTTLLRLLAGFERPGAGRLLLGEREVAGPGVFVRADQRRIGVVPQEGALFPHLTLADNVGFGLPRRAPDRAARIAELVDLIGLTGLEHRYPRELSGGPQPRDALTRALAPRPELVLLDEPFASLDADTRHGVRREVRRVLAEEKATAVMVTHDREEALSIADQVVVLRGGRVAQVGTPDEVYARPVDGAVATLLGQTMLLPVESDEGDHVVCVLGRAAVGSRAAADADAVLVRPEQVLLATDGRGTRAVVVDVELLGPVRRVRLDAAGVAVEAHLTAHPGAVAPRPGDEVVVRVAGPVHLLAAARA